MVQAPKVTPRRVAIYCRVSVEERDKPGLSIPTQRETLDLQARAQGMAVAGCYVDADVSAGIPLAVRPEGANLCAGVLRGDYDAVLATKVDRMFRDTVDCLTTDRLWRSHGCAMVLLDIGGQMVDTGTAMGQMVLTVAVAFAAFERQRIAERVRDTHAHQRNRGIYHTGPVPYGYRREKRIHEGRETSFYVPDEEKAAHLLEVFQRAAMGESTWAIASALNAAGVPSPGGMAWSPGVVDTVLSAPVYCGLCNGRRSTAPPTEAVNVDPLVPHELWQAAKAARRVVKALPTRQRNSHPLAGLVKCGACGSTAYQNRARGGVVYFRCRDSLLGGQCRHSGVRSDVIVGKVLPILAQHLDPSSLRDRRKAQTAEAKQRATRIETIDRQLARLAAAFEHEASRMSPAEYAQRSGILADERDALCRADAPMEVLPPGMTRADVLDALRAQDPTVLRAVLRAMVERIEIADGEVKRVALL